MGSQQLRFILNIFRFGFSLHLFGAGCYWFAFALNDWDGLGSCFFVYSLLVGFGWFMEGTFEVVGRGHLHVVLMFGLFVTDMLLLFDFLQTVLFLLLLIFTEFGDWSLPVRHARLLRVNSISSSGSWANLVIFGVLWVKIFVAI